MAQAIIVTESGLVLEGRGVAAPGTALGEMVFTTGMTGYQEAVTDPSYHGQILTFAAPMIGNYGAGPERMESDRAWTPGVVMGRAGNAPGTGGPEGWCDWLRSQGIVAVDDVDTRRLVRVLRDNGAMRGGISTELSADELMARVLAHPPLDGRDLTGEVAGPPRAVGEEGPLVVAIDCGIKRSIARGLAGAGCRLRIVPPHTTAQEIRDMEPDGLFLSNGPGDPAAVTGVVGTVRELLGELPIFGICLGHQMLAQAVGMDTERLPFGHRGANHPVRRTDDNRVEVTVQNHGFAVRGGEVPQGVEVTRVSLFDGSVEGIAVPARRASSVQYHPEASPGPHDARYLFAQFVEALA
ncbi:MAG: glutamine-hydrolyzing carbamoyl-phosphate synthase small subunit [Thermoleophilia bacterium]